VHFNQKPIDETIWPLYNEWQLDKGVPPKDAFIQFLLTILGGAQHGKGIGNHQERL
jgi:hypothetical protein